MKPDFFRTQEQQSARNAVQTISIPVRVRQVAQHALPEVTHQVGKNLHAQIALFAPAVAHATAQACRLFAMPAHLLLLGAQAVQTATTIQSILAARQPLAQRAHTPRKFTQTVLMNGEEVEHEVPRLKELAGKAMKKLKAVKDKQFNCSFWWPGNGMRPAEFERVRRAEKEIVQELRREKLRNAQALKDVKSRVEAQKAQIALEALEV